MDAIQRSGNWVRRWVVDGGKHGDHDQSSHGRGGSGVTKDVLRKGSNERRAIEGKIQEVLSETGSRREHLNGGTCFQATVALWDKLGQPEGLMPTWVSHEYTEHAVLYSSESGIVIDPTSMQFGLPSITTRRESKYTGWSPLQNVDDYRGSTKHGDHDQSSHGNRGGGETSIGNDVPELSAMTVDTNFKQARTIATELGFDPERVTYGGSGYKFTVNGEEFTAAANYNRNNGLVTMFDGALEDAAEVKQILAHEITHAKFHAIVYDKFSAEAVAFSKEYQSASYEVATSMARANGEVQGEYRDKYPVYSALQPYIEGPGMHKMQESDGVTDYSKAYWQAYEKGQTTYLNAVNETLAEIASLKAMGVNKGIAKVWRQAYREVSTLYDKVSK